MNFSGHQGRDAHGSDQIIHHEMYVASLTPASVATIVSDEQTFAVPGLLAGDTVIGGGPQYDLTTAVSANNMRVSAADTLAVTFTNATAGALVPAAGIWHVWIVRFKKRG